MVTVDIQREGNARILFTQEIYRLPDLKLVIKAKVTGVATRKGRPVHPGDLISRLGLES
jgi:acyl-CoA thioesterase FadM